jgi:hypothetical protein
MISELFWQCGIFLHDYGTVLKVWYFSTWFRNCSDSVVFFDNTTLSEQFRNHVRNTTLSEQFRNHVGNTTLSELFGNHVGNTTLSKQFRNHAEKYHFDIFLHDFRTVLTVWYFSTGFRNCADSVVFFDMISELFWQCGIFLHD